MELGVKHPHCAHPRSPRYPRRNGGDAKRSAAGTHSEYNIGTKLVRPENGYFVDRAEGSGTNYEVLVLYASEQRITLKYTREDTAAQGYTIHVENVCVAPDLLSAYRSLNAAGRVQLPALKQGQAFGRAMNTEIGVVIRDTGAFMDPRSEKDWW